MTRRLCIVQRPWAGHRVGAVVMIRTALADALASVGVVRALKSGCRADGCDDVASGAAPADPPATDGPVESTEAAPDTTPSARRRGRKPRAS